MSDLPKCDAISQDGECILSKWHEGPHITSRSEPVQVTYTQAELTAATLAAALAVREQAANYMKKRSDECAAIKSDLISSTFWDAARLIRNAPLPTNYQQALEQHDAAHEQLLREYMLNPDDDVIGDKVSKEFKDSLRNYVSFMHAQIQKLAAAALETREQAAKVLNEAINKLRASLQDGGQHDFSHPDWDDLDTFVTAIQQTSLPAASQKWLEQHDEWVKARFQEELFASGWRGPNLQKESRDRLMAGARLSEHERYCPECIATTDVDPKTGAFIRCKRGKKLEADALVPSSINESTNAQQKGE